MSKNIIEKILCDHITERNCFFVFPTQIAADLWADRATLVTSVTAVATERFVAWDHFKSESVRSRHQDKKSVPSAMRRIFASSVIKANAEKPFFSYIITQEYSRTAERFTDWIAKLLPELALWKKLFDASGEHPDDEDKDMMQLYERYSAFLGKYGFFDPAWETPPFEADGNHYFIFFPEILSDYMEYEAILRSSPDITIVNLPKTTVAVKSSDANAASEAEMPRQTKPAEADGAEVGNAGTEAEMSRQAKTAGTEKAGTVAFFNNSRTEIKHVAAVLQKLHEERGIPWNDIAVSVPDLDSYGAYISREFTLFEIPHVVRSAVSLSSAGAGSFFSQIRQCASSGCNYESLYTLLLNAELPWNDFAKNRNLLQFGCENHCICNYEYAGERINVWEKSFNEFLGASAGSARYMGESSQSTPDELVAPDKLDMAGSARKANEDSRKQYVAGLRGFYRSLRGAIETISNSESFEKLRDNYFAFRERFFDMSKCSARSDLILSRCIKELGNLIDLEKEYLSGEGVAYKPENPFSFFTDYISGIQYLEQTDKTGVQILPYKLGSCAPFACHVIVDASQASVSVVYEELAFLQENKRKRLTKREELNCTEDFLRLYSMNSTECDAYFTAAEKTFTGYGQTSSSLEENDMRKQTDEKVLFGSNPYMAEKRWLMSSGENQQPDDALFPERIPEYAKNSFENWLKMQPGTELAETKIAGMAQTAPEAARTGETGAEMAQTGPEAARAGETGTEMAQTGDAPAEKSGKEVSQAESAVKSLLSSNPAYAVSGDIRISKTKLKDFFFCPYNWLLKYKFNLQEQDSAATLMNQYAYGNLYHRICEMFMLSLKAAKLPLQVESGTLPEKHAALLQKSVDDAILQEDCFLSRELLGTTRTAILELMRSSMTGFSTVFSGCVVAEVEKEYSIKIPGKTYICNGRIDCLLRDPENDRYFLVDYKTSKAPDKFFPKDEDQHLPLMQQELPDFQMPMYALLLKYDEEPILVQNACFFQIKDAKFTNVFGEEIFSRNPPSGRTKPPVMLPEDFEASINKIIECMDYYAECVGTGRIETDPEVHSFVRCSQCRYRGLCRKTFNVGKKD